MKSQYKDILKDLIPPFLLRYSESIIKSGLTFKGNYSFWDEAIKNSTGYDADFILEKVKNASLKVKSGEAVYERDSILFGKIQYSFPVLAALLRAAISHEGRLSVLDFGGSLGSSYFQCKDFLSDLHSLQWYIVEQPHFVACGKEFFEDDTLKFYENIDECLKFHQPNVILLSGVLQYLEKPYDFTTRLCNYDIDYLIFDRTPFSMADEILTVQVVPPNIYPASYPSWIFDCNKLLRLLRENYSLLLEFDSNDGCVKSGKITACYKGLFLKKCIT